MLLEKGSRFADFTVIKDYGNDEAFFRLLTDDGQEVHLKKLRFQLSQPLPDTLSCKVKGYNGDTPVLSHNMPRYVNDFYAEGYRRGDDFDFRVVEAPRGRKDHYIVEDDKGMQFKLEESGTVLTVGQTVRCRFTFMDDRVFMLRRSDSDTKLPLLSVYDLITHTGADIKTDDVVAFMRADADLASALRELESGRPSWIFTALRCLRLAMPRLFKQAIEEMDKERLTMLLDAYHNLCLYLLQNSGFLREIGGSERTSMQDILTAQLEHIEAYQQATAIIFNNRQKEFIAGLLSNLKESGYLYHPALKLQTMMILFRMNPELVNSSLGNIFDTLMGWSPDTWRTEPFRQAFVDQLEIYILDTRDQIDSILQAETADDNEKVEKMLTAIAIQHNLASTADRVDLRRNMSLFYRYLSLLRTACADTLLQKSYLTTMGVSLPNELTWSEIKMPTMMMTRATVPAPPTATVADTRLLLTDTVEVQIDSEGIAIGRNDVVDDQLIVNGMLGWPGFKVYASAKQLNRQRIKNLDAHNDFWNEVEQSLFMPRETTVDTAGQRRRPEVDDYVRIIVDYVITPHDGAPIYHCKMVDDNYIEGEGTMDSRDVANYNQRSVSPATFRHNNRPMAFYARVVDIDPDEQPVFSLHDQSVDAIRDLVNTGEDVFAVIKKAYETQYIALTDHGYGIVLNRDPETPPFVAGSVVHATVTGFNNDIAIGHINDGPIDAMRIDEEASFRKLLYEMSIKEDDSADDTDYDRDQLISADDMREIVEILRYKAISLSNELITSFDYLSVARILALVIGDDSLAATIKAHKEIILLQQYYSTNRTIDPADIERVLAIAPANPLIRRLAARLQVVGAMGHSERNADLWDIVNGDSNDTLRELAQMVLAYNMLSSSGADDTANPIRNRIASMLNASSEQRHLKYYGSESQYVEFKSSLVYPARKGRSGISAADPDKQEFEILHIIAGFMNTTGGTLYIGVSDDHYERGLEEDMSYYRLDRSERNTPHRRAIASADNMANYLQNLIDRAYNIGINAGTYARTGVDDEASKDVIFVKVEPCPHPITLDDKIFVRHGTKTEPLTDQADIDLFIADRERHYNIQNRVDQAATADKGSATEASAPPKPATTPAETPIAPDDDAEAQAVATEAEKPSLTSRWRPNILHEYEDVEKFVAPKFYLRFLPDNRYVVTTNEWSADDTDLLVLAISDDEAEGSLLMVFDGERAMRVPFRTILEKDFDQPHKHFDGPLLFAAPIADGDGLYSIHANSKGQLWERVTPADRITSGAMTAIPDRIVEAESTASPFYDMVPAAKMGTFDKIMAANINRKALGSPLKGSSTGTLDIDTYIADILASITR